MSYPLSDFWQIMKPCKPDFKKASHASKLESIYKSANHLAEEKLDGIHGTYISGHIYTIHISKETGLPNEKTDHLPHILTPAFINFWGQAIMEGEIVYPQRKVQAVTSVLNSSLNVCLMKQKTQGLLHYVVYDMLCTPDGRDLRNVPCGERRRILDEYVRSYQSMFTAPYFRSNETYLCSEIDVPEMFSSVVSKGGEGLVLKDINALYVNGKRPMWNQIKIKASMEDDVVIMGTKPAKPGTKFDIRGQIGSLQVGKYKDGELVSVGYVSGMSDALRGVMSTDITPYIGKVIRVRAMEMNETGGYRHASFLNFHEDKNDVDCIIE